MSNFERKEREKIEHLKKQSENMWLTDQYIERPCIVLAVCLVLFTIATILTISLDWFKLSDQGNRDWYVWDHKKVEHKDMLVQAQEAFQKSTSKDTIPLQTDENYQWSTIIMLECRSCDNVLTEKGIELLLKAEQGLRDLNNYSSFCLKELNQKDCSKKALFSFTNILRQSTKNDKLTDINNNQLTNAINFVLEDPNFPHYSYLFGKEFSSSNKQTKLLRNEFKFGSPIKFDGKTYKNKFDDEQEQYDHFQDFSDKIIDLADDLNSQDNDGITVLLMSQPITSKRFSTIMQTDLLYAIFSIIFVLIYLTFHLKSLFLSSLSMLGILMSFTMTFIFFRGIFQVEYFSFLHILVIFIVLGIAADDIFVYYDAWNQTNHYDFLKDDKKKRMAVTFRRASNAMLATSFTTSASFAANVFSGLMPISSFGIFASILIPMNYLIVITYFPVILIIQETYFAHWCSCKKKKKQQDLEDPLKESQQQQEEKKESIIERFFANQFNTFIFKGRLYILGFSLALIIGAIVLAAQMGPQTTPEQFLPDDHEVQRTMFHIQNDLHASAAGGGNYITVSLYWGTSDLNKEDVEKWDSEYPGEVVWDEKFNLAPEENQAFLYEMCNTLRSHEIVLKDVGKLECFMLDFKEYLQFKNKPFPVPEEDFLQTIEEFSQSSYGITYYYKQQIGLIDNKLRYVQILVPSIGDPEAGYESQEKIDSKWHDLVKLTNQKSPQGLKDLKYTSETFAWMITQKELISSAIQGILISISLALVVLVIFSLNILVSLYSVLSISCIVACVVAVMELSGWSLGITESIAVVVLIGMSVDYVVHLANHYVESSYDDKYSRTQEALKEIGISILSGGATTVGAGSMLFFCTVTVFTKFGLLIVVTILFSFYFAMIFFTAFMHTIGPEGNQGNIKKWFKKKGDETHSNSNYNDDDNSNNDNDNSQKKIIGSQSKNTQIFEMSMSSLDTENSQTQRQQDSEKQKKLREQYTHSKPSNNMTINFDVKNTQ